MAPPHSVEVTAEVSSAFNLSDSVVSFDEAKDDCPPPRGELLLEAEVRSAERSFREPTKVLLEEDAAAILNQLEDATLAGLAQPIKSLLSKYFYDDTGSQLFQKITNLPEYYLTAAEAEVIDTHGGAMLSVAGVCAGSGPVNVIELGAGDGCKTVSLLRHLVATGADAQYAPVDISREAMHLLYDMLSRSDVAGEVPVRGVVGDYIDGLDWLVARPPREALSSSPPPAAADGSPVTSPSDSVAASDDEEGAPAADGEDVRPSVMTAAPPGSPRNLVVFLGSSLGNFSPTEALAFLRAVRERLRPSDGLLIGYDLKKSPATLVPAYADAAGVTAAFNYNLLERLNRDVGANFDVSAFEHQAVYNPVAGTMESYLLSTRQQTVHVGRGARRTAFAFDAWEPIHTEFSHKYTTEQMGRLAEAAGFRVVRNFTDAAGRFVDAVWTVA